MDFHGLVARFCRAPVNPASLWESLEKGDSVTMTLRGYEYHSGTVDDLTADGRIIWITDRIGDRRLFHIDDDFELTLSPTRRGTNGVWPA